MQVWGHLEEIRVKFHLRSLSAREIVFQCGIQISHSVVMLFHVDGDLGINSILMYSPGLTCQKVHVKKRKKNPLSFSTFSAQQQCNEISCVCLPLCASLSLSLCLPSFLCLCTSHLDERLFFLVYYLTLH